MKMKVLFLPLVVVSAFGISAVVGADKTPVDPESSWGLHEPLKSCVLCHATKPDTDSTEKVDLVKPVPDLCYGCHKEHVTTDMWKHGPVATGECLLCHESHETTHRSLLSNPIPELCHHCHEPRLLRLVPNHTEPSHATCTTCHEAHASPGRMLLKQAYLETDDGQAYMSNSSSARPRPTFVDRRGSLSGLGGVDIVPVLNGSSSLSRYGVTEELIRTNVKRHLRRNGVRILSSTEEDERESSLHVRVRLMGVPSGRRPGQIDILSASISVYLQQAVELLGTDLQGRRRFCTATTWDTGAIALWGVTQAREGFDEAIGMLVDRFGEDYRAANPEDPAVTPNRQEGAGQQ